MQPKPLWSARMDAGSPSDPGTGFAGMTAVLAYGATAKDVVPVQADTLGLPRAPSAVFVRLRVKPM